MDVMEFGVSGQNPLEHLTQRTLMYDFSCSDWIKANYYSWYENKKICDIRLPTNYSQKPIMY